MPKISSPDGGGREGAGKLDHHKALTGDDLTDFVNNKLFPYLKKFKLNAESADTIEYKIGEIFSELKKRIQSGYNLREVINRIDELRFRTHAEKHEMSHLYEDKIKNMGNAGRNGGEYYTPRPLITTIVRVVAPKIGDKIYDGACGSAGFLCEAFAYLNKNGLSTKDTVTLQKKTFYGKEKKSLAYIIGIMNMICAVWKLPTSYIRTPLPKTLPIYRKKTAMMWCLPIRLLVERNVPKCNKTSRLKRVKLLRSFCSTLLKF